MILLLGGTSETAAIAAALAAAGLPVLVSTATDLASSVRESDRVAVRAGALDEPGLLTLIVGRRAQVVVDATHPYAAAATRNALRAARRAGVPYLRYLRPAALAADAGASLAADHDEASRRAFLAGRPVLLTIGTRNLMPYVRESERTAVALFARVLPTPASLRACRDAGLPAERVTAAQGPFSVAETADLIRRHGIGVLVTKDGGDAGGFPQKLAAARCEGCEVVVVARPAEPAAAEHVFSDVGALVAACSGAAARARA